MMEPTSMASSIIGSVSGLTSHEGTINLLWNSICNYVELNGVVTCTWLAFSPSTPPTPDPLNGSIPCSVLTAAGRVLSLEGIDRLTDASSVLGFLSAAMNVAVQSWQALLPSTLGFLTSPGVVLIPSTIFLTPSMSTDRFSAFEHMASEIIRGLGSVEFSPTTGSHSIVYTGAGAFSPGIH